MRISDWSSDVCSSDLLENLLRIVEHRGGGIERQRAARHHLRIVPARPLLVADRDHVIGEDAPECGVRDRRRAVIVRRRMGMRKTGKRSEEHTSELQSLMRISYAVFCLTKKNTIQLIFCISIF